MPGVAGQCLTCGCFLHAQGIKQLAELPANVSAAQALPSLRSGLSGLESKLACAGPLRLSRYSGGGAVAFRN
jgi:hypothetical protein